MENNHHDDIQPSGDDTLLARWLAGELSPEDLEALRNLEGYPDYVEMLHALEGMEMDEYSPTLAWQKLQAELAVRQLAVGSQVPEEVGSSQSETEVNPSADASTTATEVDSSPVGSQETEEVVSANVPIVPVAEQQTINTPSIAKQGKLDFDAPKPVENQPIVAQPKVVKLQPNWQRWAAIAAAVLVGVIGIWWFSRDDNFSFTDTAYQTKVGENKEVKLPDGTVVMINAMSKLGFAATEWQDGRKVALDGEAFFKAKKGKTFTVSTDQGTVEVVGTIFNVYARGEELEVKCSEGRVQVTNPDATERVLLKAGEQVRVLRGKMQKREGVSFYPKWFKGESTFRSASLERVFGEMERQYGVKVLADSLDERTFSGKFVNNDLQKAVKMVCAPMKLNCEVRGDTVFVH